ncbi:MAG: hypothetical protein ACLP7Q_20110 [Isosphaeraceae bacterium]
MPGSLVVYKQDGTRQCEDIKPRPLAEDAAVITGLGLRIVGEGRNEHLPILVPALCGWETAMANVFTLDSQGITRQQLFELSKHGFKIWEFPEAPTHKAEGHDPFLIDVALAGALLAPERHPDRIHELIGYAIRVYKRGDIISEDFRRDRVNFELTPDTARIARVWFG